MKVEARHRLLNYAKDSRQSIDEIVVAMKLYKLTQDEIEKVLFEDEAMDICVACHYWAGEGEYDYPNGHDCICNECSADQPIIKEK